MDAPAASLQVLTAMITPAVLISASGTLGFSTSSRLSRVVDRVRSLSDQMERMSLNEGTSQAFTEDKRALILDQLSRLARRVLLLRQALTSVYVGIGFFVSTSLAIGLVALTGSRFGWIPVLFGILGSCALLWASVLLVTEGRQAVTSTLNEMRFVKDGVSRLQARSGSR